MPLRSLFQLLMCLSFGLALPGCSNLLYYPTRVKYINEKLLNPVPEQVELNLTPKSSSKTPIYSWYFKNRKGQPHYPTVLYFHGNGQNMSAHFQSLYWLLRHNVNLFVLDYPGYGISHGQPTPKNTLESGRLALEWIRKHDPASPVAIYGQSLGSAIALRTTIEALPNKPCHITIEAGFESYQTVARQALSRAWFTWLFQPLAYILISDRYAPEDQLYKLQGIPHLVFHNTEDPVIDFDNGLKLATQLNYPKDSPTQLVPINDNSHYSVFHGPEKDKARKIYIDHLKQHCFKKAGQS